MWLESGASYLALIAVKLQTMNPHYPWPSDLYLEGGDQYRGWFQSSLLCAMGTHATPPYKGVVTPGWTLDEKGQAMSKSRGNDVDPVDISSRLGGEVVRLWVASVDFREDVVGSEALMQRVGENYREIRNKLFKNALGNLFDFDPQTNASPSSRWTRSISTCCARRRRGARHSQVVRRVRVSQDLSARESLLHRGSERVLFRCNQRPALYLRAEFDRPAFRADRCLAHCEAMARLLAPILTFTCEEVWQHLPKVQDASTAFIGALSRSRRFLGMPQLQKMILRSARIGPLCLPSANRLSRRWKKNATVKASAKVLKHSLSLPPPIPRTRY